MLKSIIRRTAQRQGFLDPFALMASLDAFARPSEVSVPKELLRAGVVFHARGLLNTKVIQSNLDWHWPYWICQQFDPRSPSFLPRSFSVTHVNLSHRNWTAIGIPDCPLLPVIDPRGLTTLWYDGWSLDFFLQRGDGTLLIPARCDDARQTLLMGASSLAIETETNWEGATLNVIAEVVERRGHPWAVLSATATGEDVHALGLGIRPFNPEGIELVSTIESNDDGTSWRVNGLNAFHVDRAPERRVFSVYDDGDALNNLEGNFEKETRAKCRTDLASAAMLFRRDSPDGFRAEVRAPLRSPPDEPVPLRKDFVPVSWEGALGGLARLHMPHSNWQFLYDAAIRTLVLHSPGDVYPGPYTYKRFWFRDAALILNAMIGAGMIDRSRRAINKFPARQDRHGYFCSQEGEWDSNGQVLWIIKKFLDASGESAPPEWREAIHRGADWIIAKRLPSGGGEPHEGLLPAGFSAEHLGNNDYYFWDDFFGLAGLEAAERLSLQWKDKRRARVYRSEALSFRTAIVRAMRRSPGMQRVGAIPASPYRRMDAGAIGSLAAGYPLQLFTPRNVPLMATAHYLRCNCFVDGAFFQDMIHSGINAYLSLHVAQVLLRAGDRNFLPVVERIAELASPTGQWPEAIHPRTGGGCMGDGQHVWAAAEWVMMMRALFVREENGALVLGAGLLPKFFERSPILEFGSTPTPYGPITVRAERLGSKRVEIAWDADWRAEPPAIDIRIPGTESCALDPARVREGGMTVALRE
ncbi:MAG: hypothetical protein PWP23_2664 [Candidatus Sumerlaeota bacterium]|nr:hypothetical protein [Candidatus Sumerlaeota bacterium]